MPPIACHRDSPGGAGILSVAFLNCFTGGVEFRWGDPYKGEKWVPDGSDGSDDRMPALTFLGDDAPAAFTAGLSAAPVRVLPASGLPCVMLRVNGVDVPALLDTGSPITVLNRAAAAAARVDAPPVPLTPAAAAAAFFSGGNPLARLQAAAAATRDSIEAATAPRQRGPRGDTLQIGGADGQPVTLVRAAPAEFALGDAAFGDATRVFVGELPMLAVLDGLGADAGPAAVLGTDVLQRRPRMVYRAHEILL